MKRIALITGVGSGIGAGTATVFMEAGWDVIGLDRNEDASSKTLTRFLHADVSDPEAMAEVFADIKKREGHLDALVNNAAIQLCSSIANTTPEEWDRVMATNVRSIFLAARAATPLMKQQPSAIVNVSSVHAMATSPDISAYAASKGAVLALTRALALELAPDGIRVNAVLPGAVDTPMLREGVQRGNAGNMNEEELLASLGKRHPIGRIGTPEEIGEAIFFLADNKRSSFITGQSLIVDGGALSRLSVE